LWRGDAKGWDTSGEVPGRGEALCPPLEEPSRSWPLLRELLAVMEATLSAAWSAADMSMEGRWLPRGLDLLRGEGAGRDRDASL
jgi:hypothetical protein